MAATNFAPGFPDRGNVLPVNTQPLTDSQTTSALAAAAVGAAPGATATVARTRVANNGSVNRDNGGKVALETVNPINRATTAADVTALKTANNKFSKQILKKPSFAMPKDLSGNGGPAFTRS